MGILTAGPVADGFTGTRTGVCNLCEAICGLELTLEKGRVTSIRGNDADGAGKALGDGPIVHRTGTARF